MKIINARDVKWTAFANPAMTQVLVDAIPNYQSMLYDTADLGNGQTAYFAEQDGYVSFYIHDASNENGFGGASFALTLRDGSDVVLRGPWTSRPDVMTALGFPESVDVSITDRPTDFERGFFRSGHLLKTVLDSYGEREYIER